MKSSHLLAGLESLTRFEEEDAAAEMPIEEIAEAPEAGEVPDISVEVAVKVGEEAEEQAAMEEAFHQLELTSTALAYSLHSYDRVEAGMKALEADGLSRTFVTIMNADGMLDSFAGTVLPGCESFDAVGTRSGSEYTACMEGFKETMKNWGASIAAFFKRILKFITEAIARMLDRVARLETAVGNIGGKKDVLSKVDGAKFGEKSVRAMSKAAFDKLKGNFSKAVSMLSSKELLDESWLKGISDADLARITGSTPIALNQVALGLGYKVDGGKIKPAASIEVKKAALKDLKWAPADIAGEYAGAKSIVDTLRGLKAVEGALKKKMEAAVREAEGIDRLGDAEKSQAIKRGVKAFQARTDLCLRLLSAVSKIGALSVQSYIAVGQAAYSLVEKSKEEK